MKLLTFFVGSDLQTKMVCVDAKCGPKENLSGIMMWYNISKVKHPALNR